MWLPATSDLMFSHPLMKLFGFFKLKNDGDRTMIQMIVINKFQFYL